MNFAQFSAMAAASMPMISPFDRQVLWEIHHIRQVLAPPDSGVFVSARKVAQARGYPVSRARFWLNVISDNDEAMDWFRAASQGSHDLQASRGGRGGWALVSKLREGMAVVEAMERD